MQPRDPCQLIAAVNDVGKGFGGIMNGGQPLFPNQFTLPKQQVGRKLSAPTCSGTPANKNCNYNSVALGTGCGMLFTLARVCPFSACADALPRLTSLPATAHMLVDPQASAPLSRYNVYKANPTTTSSSGIDPGIYYSAVFDFSYAPTVQVSADQGSCGESASASTSYSYASYQNSNAGAASGSASYGADSFSASANWGSTTDSSNAEQAATFSYGTSVYLYQYNFPSGSNPQLSNNFAQLCWYLLQDYAADGYVVGKYSTQGADSGEAPQLALRCTAPRPTLRCMATLSLFCMLQCVQTSQTCTARTAPASFPPSTAAHSQTS